MAFDSNIKGYMTFGKSFSRGGAFPLEAYEIWTDYDALVAYAANTNPDKDPSYIGQKVAYVDKENNKVTHYGIECDGSLKELGATPIGDEKSIIVDETNYTISLKGVDGLVFERDIIGEDGEPTGDKEEVKFQPLMTKDGLVWVEPSKTTVEGLATLISELTVRVKALEDDRVTEQELTDAIKDFVTDGELTEAIKDFATDTELANAIAAVEAKIPSVPTDVSAFNNDAGYLVASDIADKADKADTLAGYGITDAYTKTEVDTALGDKADADDLTALAEKVDAFLTGDGTEAALDSLKELIKYIEEHDDVELADIISDIEALQTKVDTGDQKVSEYVAAAIAALKIGDYAKAADLTTLAGRVSTLEAKPFDTYATKDEVNAKADASALDNYYTKTEVNGTLDNYITRTEFGQGVADFVTNSTLDTLENSIEETYATKDELKATDDVAKDAQNRVGIVEGKIDEITSVGGEPNVIEKIKVNGVTLEVEKDAEGKSTKTVSISVPTALEDLTGYTELNGKVTANTNAISALDGRVTTNANAITALEGQLGTTNTNVSGITTRLAALEAEVGEVAESRIDALEGATAQHTTDIAANTAAITTINTTTIPALEAAIAAETKAREDGDKAINEKIGTVESGKTVVDMINAVAGTIDFTPYATNARVDEIYKVDGETKSGVLADTIADVDANTAAIALLNDEATKEGSVKHTVATELAKIVADADADYDTLKEIADWITNDTTGAAKMANDITALNTKVDTGDKTVTEYVAHYHTENQYVLPAATVAALGGIKSAADVVNGEETTVATNKVYVDATSSVGEVKAISTDILVNGSEELVLFGGNANVTA